MFDFSRVDFAHPLLQLVKSSNFLLIYGLAGLIQTALVMLVIRHSFQGTGYYSSIGWTRAFSYALLFVGAMSLLALGLSSALVFGLPYIAPYLDVLTLLGKVAPLNEQAAAHTRPWAYSLAILAALGFLVWRIKSLRMLQFGWVHAGQVVLVLFSSNILFQFLTYGILSALMA
jgi:hypothetical protein